MAHLMLGCLLIFCLGASINAEGGFRDGGLVQSLDSNKLHLFKESIPQISTRLDISRISRMRNDHLHEVVFVIHQKNMEELTEFLHDVSDPSSMNYGKHMRREEVASLTRNQEARDAVVSFLHTNGASLVSETLGSEYITASAPVILWERLLDCKFYMYRQMDGKRVVNTLVRAESYSIPAILGQHVDSVFNTIQMPYRQSASEIVYPRYVEQSMEKMNLESNGKYISPSALKSYYNLGTIAGSNSSTQAIYASYEQNFSPADLLKFQSTSGTTKQSIKTVIGDHSSSSVCTTTPELCVTANLHVQYLLAISPDSPTTFWYTDNDGFSSWLVKVANTKDPPLVLTISYYIEEPYVSGSELDAFNIQAIKLGAMGVTIVVPSGDDGAISGLVRVNDTSKCSYSPSFPASSQYVTAVGATSGPEKATVEVVCQAGATTTITSGGGFSYYYPQPLFQKGAVDGYFKQCSLLTRQPYRGYNSEGRAYPDISLAGLDYQYYIGGVESLYSGTGASATVVAGIFSNINAARNSVGKGSIGWVNPALYMNHTSYVKDIIEGSNRCGGSSTVGYFKCCRHGFSATPGWDPTTGLGSLNYQKMKKHFLLLGEIKSVTSAPSSSKPTLRPTSSPSSTLTPKPTRSTPSSTPSALLQAASSKSSSTRLQGLTTTTTTAILVIISVITVLHFP